MNHYKNNKDAVSGLHFLDLSRGHVSGGSGMLQTPVAVRRNRPQEFIGAFHRFPFDFGLKQYTIYFKCLLKELLISAPMQSLTK